MRNFIFFIRRFFNLILFLTLEVMCIVMIERTNTLQGNDIVSSANAVSGLVYKKQNDVVYYFGLRRMNDSLQNENARLRQIIEQYRSLDTLSDSLVKTKTQVGDTAKHIVRYAEYVYRTARVINNSVNATDNFITINRGSRHGIGKNMAVLSGSGVVGRVEHVSANYSSILSVLSAKQRVSARLKNIANGFVVWEGKNPRVLTMIDVPQQVEVKKGDSVFTNSYSLYFPPEVLIGTVIKTEPIKKNAMQHIYLKSSTDFANLQYVYVVENKMRQEKTQLEDSSIKK
ncbi:MAG: rod shape-determining protein MreC [Chitinophagaceae bacterium]|nr:rod shape-determining protein MreC [Chitinophagaceae bacterium]